MVELDEGGPEKERGSEGMHGECATSGCDGSNGGR